MSRYPLFSEVILARLVTDIDNVLRATGSFAFQTVQDQCVDHGMDRTGRLSIVHIDSLAAILEVVYRFDFNRFHLEVTSWGPSTKPSVFKEAGEYNDPLAAVNAIVRQVRAHRESLCKGESP